ncbi:hypothetical protein ACWDV4_20635 [Micromonospora sp. NPDC003197]
MADTKPAGMEQSSSEAVPRPSLADVRVTPERLRSDIGRLAGVLRARAEGVTLSHDERGAIKALSGEKVMAAALRYAELLVDGEILAARLIRGNRQKQHRLTGLKNKLAAQRNIVMRKLHTQHEQELAEARRPGRAPDYLDALVMRHVGGKPFRDALAAVLKRRGLRPDGIDVPASQLWAWLASSGVDPTCAEVILSTEVRRLRQMSDDQFSQVLLDDAQGTEPNDFLAHHAVVERWAAHADKLEEQLREVREERATERAHQDRNRRLAADAEAYARAGARNVMASLIVKDLLTRVVRTHRQIPAQELRATCLAEAASEVSRSDPALGQLVADACHKHRTRCPKVNNPHPCRDCAGQVASLVKAQRPEQTGGQPAPPASVGSCQGDGFVCSDVIRHPSHKADVVAVVAVHSESDSGLFGFGWITEDGELGTGSDRSAGPHDSSVQALCRTALEFAVGGTRVHIICRDAKATAVVQHALRSGMVPADLGFTVSEQSRALLVDLAGRWWSISVSADPCAQPHSGAFAAEQLAALAWRARHGVVSSSEAKAEVDRILLDCSREMGHRLTGPTEEDDHAWWLSNVGGSGDLVWQVALYRMHLDGGWCGLPDGLSTGVKDGLRLQLRIEHKDRQPGPAASTHDVTLRGRGGQWELDGIRWPKTLLPGTLVTFKWRAGTSLVTARTALLPEPELVDGFEFLHRYDAQVVTREVAPGSDQDRDVPDLSDTSWVMRTLRKLGYLSVDGTATLAEDALKRNCLELGLPSRRLGRIGAAVDQLLRSGRIQRVEGSLDQDGRPWYPPRPGQVRSDLLRWVPQVEALDPSVRREIHEALSARRRGHWVTGFVRRLPPGAQASAEQVDLHREAVYTAEVVDRALPEGFTYVRRHQRSRNRRGH